MHRVLRWVLWCAAVAAAAGFVAAGVRELMVGPRYDPLEALILDRAARIAAGLPLVPVDAESGAALMPGAPLVVSVLVRLFDPQLWEPRLMALLARCAAALLVAWVVHRETKSATLGAAGAMVVLAAELLVQAPAAAAPESLALLLALLGYCSLRFLGMTGSFLAAVALAAACFTHPDGLWFTLAAIAHLGVHDRRRFFACGPTLLVLLGGAHLALGRSLGPAYNQEAWNAFLDPMRFAPVALLRYVGSQLLGTFGVLTLGAVLAFTLPVRPWRGAVGLWTWGALAALGAGIAATQSGSTASDALRPAAFALALVGPISIQRVTQHLSAWPGSSRMAGQRVMLTALLLQSLTLLSSLSAAHGAG